MMFVIVVFASAGWVETHRSSLQLGDCSLWASQELDICGMEIVQIAAQADQEFRRSGVCTCKCYGLMV